MRGFASASCAFAVIIVLGFAAPAQAVQYLYESFNYAPGANLKDQPGWREPGGAPNDTVLDKIVAPTLNFPGLTPQGNALQTGGKYSFDAFDDPSNGYIGGNGNTFWFSFLLKRTAAGNGGVIDPDYGGLILGGNPDPSNNLFIGKPGAGATDKYVLEDTNGNNQVASSLTESLGTTAYLAVKITFHDAGAEDISLFANPSTLVDGNDLVPSATKQMEMFSFNAFYISAGVNATWQFDEIKIGSTFADVAPEPASMATLLSAASLLLARRRQTTSRLPAAR